ncbi:MAG: hypothetical protein ACP5RT_03170 [Candidatus Micrarchaeia archaeon]
MRGQQSIEFLSTYSFLIIMLGILASVILYFAVLPQASLPQGCTSFSGPFCYTVRYFSNTSASYSEFLFALGNSENFPINLTNITVDVKNNIYEGVCYPSFLEPGMSTICLASNSSTTSLGSYIQGFYSIGAKACNSGISTLGSNCNETISYGGSFSVSKSISIPILFAVAVAAGPERKALPSYESSPSIPQNWSIVQNGFWSEYKNGYAYTTTSTYNGIAVGFILTPFPQVSSFLNGNGLCSYPYNSEFSMASSLIYLPKSTNIGVSMDTGGAAEIYYKGYGSSTWSEAFNGLAWKLQSPTIYSNTMALNSGIAKISVVWSGNCFGIQALNFSNLPQ